MINVRKTLDLLNFFLVKLEQKRSFIICGRASLILQGLSDESRGTSDIDVLAPEIDGLLKEASLLVSNKLDIDPSWLNMGPRSLLKDLPENWDSKLVKVYSASNLEVFSIGREELIFSKFWAFCDRQRDLQDLLDMDVTPNEAIEAAEKVKNLDGHPDWPQHVVNMREVLLRKISNG